MKRKERLRDANFAWDVLEQAPYAVLALSSKEGVPYCIPVSPAVDREYGAIYVHCAKAGKKMDLLRENPRVCLSAVSKSCPIPKKFEMSFDSAVFMGTVEEVVDEGEKVKALLLLGTHYDPAGMSRFEEVLERYLPATCVLRITPTEITGKQAKEPPAAE